VATRAQQVIILRSMQDKVARALALAGVFALNNVELIPENPDTTVTLSQAQKDALGTAFDTQVAGVKSDAATL
jgi:hypothetical protein